MPDMKALIESVLASCDMLDTRANKLDLDDMLM
jgi:hypothetical protein